MRKVFFYIAILLLTETSFANKKEDKLEDFTKNDLIKPSILDGTWISDGDDGSIVIFKISSAPYSQYEISKNKSYSSWESVVASVIVTSVDKRKERGCLIPEEIHARHTGIRTGEKVKLSSILFRDFGVVSQFVEIDIKILDAKNLEVHQIVTSLEADLQSDISYKLIKVT